MAGKYIDKYNRFVKHRLEEITEWRRAGKTSKYIADKLGISYFILYEYKKKYKKLDEAMNVGKEQLIDEMKKSLFEIAKGYDYEEVQTEIEQGFNGGEKKKIKKIKKHVPPNVGALIFVLCNFAPEEFQNTNKDILAKNNRPINLTITNKDKPSKRVQDE